MRANPLRTLWKSGGAAVNGWLAIPNSFAAETMAHQGWDSLTIDLQHGLVDYQAMVPMLQAISTTDTMPFVRVPWNEPSVIMKYLDAGAYGIIVPMIETKEDAERAVWAMRYPPAGMRSSGPFRATIYGGSDYQANANDELLLAVMIETAKAIENLDAIAFLDLSGITIAARIDPLAADRYRRSRTAAVDLQLDRVNVFDAGSGRRL